jgi:hypothetical protein
METIVTADAEHFDPMPEDAPNYDPIDIQEQSSLPVIVTTRRGGKVM